MKSPSDERARRDSGRRAQKSVNQSPQLAIPEAVELPEPPVLPDVYTKDRRSIHPTRKQRPQPPSKKRNVEEK